MTKLTFYKYAALLLLVLNVGMLMYFMGRGCNNSPQRHKGNDRREVKNKPFDFTEEQEKVFRAAGRAHHELMRDLKQQQSEYAKSYLLSVVEGDTTAANRSDLEHVQRLEKEKLERTYFHLAKVKTLLTEEQQDDFEPFVEHIISKMGEKKNRRRPRRSETKG